MNRNWIIYTLSAIVLAGAIAVMFGWFLDIAILKSLLPSAVTMKFITSVCFLFSAILVFLLAKKEKNEWINFSILIISFTLFLLMITFFISLFVGISTGIESLFVKEVVGAVKTSVPGVPAVPTMICFIFIGLVGLFFVYDPKSNKGNFWLGIITSIIGGLALAGYILNIPQLYYTFKGFTSMSLITSFLFVLIGISLMLIRGEEK